MVCKICFKMQNKLSTHLKRVCRKNADEAEIKELVEEARSKMRHVVRQLSVIAYKDLEHPSSVRPHQFCVSFLEARGSIVLPETSGRQRYVLNLALFKGCFIML